MCRAAAGSASPTVAASLRASPVYTQAVRLFSAYCEERGAMTPEAKLVCDAGKVVRAMAGMPAQGSTCLSPAPQRPILLPKAYVGTLLQVWHRVAKHFPRRTYFVRAELGVSVALALQLAFACAPPAPTHLCT